MFIIKLYRNWSIKVRLCIFLILASTVFSYLMYGMVHSTLHESLAKQHNDLVNDRLQMLRAIVEEKSDYLQIIGDDIKWEARYIAFPHYYLRLLDEKGQTLLETPGMTGVVPGAWIPPGDRNHDLIRQAPNGRYYFLRSDTVTPHLESARKLTMQIALDVTSAINIDEANHAKMMLLSLLRALVFAGIIAVIVSRTLKPLDELIDFSKGITVRKLSERTTPENWPREVKNLGLSLNAMLDRLEESMTRLSDCAANMAHEIRTPINNLMGEAEITLMRERSPQEYVKVLESGMEEYARISRLVDNLLFLGHADNPGMEIEPVPFDPATEVEGIFALFAARAEQKKAKLSVRGDAYLYGDPLLFRRAVSNLVANAMYYSGDGVRVGVSIAESERWVEVAVSDTGYGIPQQDLPRIFERFYRGDASRSNYADGSGLGLSIVKAIMELHRGSVTIDSRVGEGTTFTLRFPRPSTGAPAA